MCSRDELKNDRRYLGFKKRLDYFNRMIIPYGSNDAFIFQYLEGSGSELKNKFFSNHSSSRLSFELYSWLANEETVKNFCFEMKLKGIKGSKGVPNMDVYFERDNRIIFIESKYTETSDNKLESIPDAYYKDLSEHPRSFDKKTLLQSTLKERFYGDEKFSQIFSSFVKEVISNCGTNSWFDIKQEITHLFGISKFILDTSNKKLIKNKNIEFYNIVFDFGDFHSDKIHEKFIAEAKKMMNKLKEIKSLDFNNFIYDAKTIQEVVKKIPLNKLSFGSSNITVRQRLKEFNLD